MIDKRGEWMYSHILKGKLRNNMSKGLKVSIIGIRLHQTQYDDKWLEPEIFWLIRMKITA